MRFRRAEDGRNGCGTMTLAPTERSSAACCSLSSFLPVMDGGGARAHQPGTVVVLKEILCMPSGCFTAIKSSHESGGFIRLGISDYESISHRAFDHQSEFC